MSRKSLRQHWYRTIVYTCPPCGAEESRRERVYGKPPAKYSSRRWVHKVRYNYCVEYGNL